MRLERDTAVNLLQEIAAENPDYVYTENNEECVYFHDNGTPACIVGQVFARLGVEGKTFVDFRANTCLVSSNWVKDKLPFEISDEATWALAIAQDKQDEGKTWTEAVEGL